MYCKLLKNTVLLIFALLLIASGACCSAKPQQKVASVDWRMYLSNSSNSGYQPKGPASLSRLSWDRQFKSSWGADLSNPVVIGDRVYVVAYDGYLRALDTGSGTEAWRLLLQEQSAFNGLCSNGTTIFYQFANVTVSIDPALRKMRWARSIHGGVWTSPPVDRDGLLFSSSNDRKLYAVDQDSGVVQWQALLSGSGERQRPPCSSGTDIYYISTSMDSWARLYSQDSKSGKQNWEKPFEFGTPTAIAFESGRIIFGIDSTFYALDTESGETLWSSNVNGNIHSFYLQNKQIVAALSDFDDNWRVQSLSSKTGELGRIHAGGAGGVTTPIIGSSGLAILGTSSKMIVVIDLNDASKIKEFSTGKGRPVNLALADNALYVTTSEGHIMCFVP